MGSAFSACSVPQLANSFRPSGPSATDEDTALPVSLVSKLAASHSSKYVDPPYQPPERSSLITRNVIPSQAQGPRTELPSEPSLPAVEVIPPLEPGPQMEVRVQMLSGVEQVVKLPENARMLELRTALYEAFGVPSFEQKIRLNAEDPAQAFELVGGDMRTLLGSDSGFEIGCSLILIRCDLRTTMEKNCDLLQALWEMRLSDALLILNSSGFPVDPDCIYHHRDTKGHSSDCNVPPADREAANIRRDFEPYKSEWSALSLAVKARQRWDYTNMSICGEGATEEEVIQVIQRLIELGASVNVTGMDTLSFGSWPDSNNSRTPLYIAVQIGSVNIVKILLDAGADPDQGMVNQKGRANSSSRCEDALRNRRDLDHAVRQEITSLLADARKSLQKS